MSNSDKTNKPLAKKNASKKKVIKKATNKKITPRIAATLIINQLLKQQGSLSSLLPEYTEAFSPQEKSFIRECCYGCCRWFVQLDKALSALLKQPLKKKESDIKAVLLLGLYQLQFMRIAEHAAINESVNAANYFKKPWAKKLINAVLRSFQRENKIQDNAQDKKTIALFEKVVADNPSAHPQWLEQRIKQAWPEQANTIFSANNQHPPLTLRVNQQRVSRIEYLDLLNENNIKAEPARFSDVGIYLDAPHAVNMLPLFEQGGISVQDEAAQLAANLLELKPGLHVLDACCAPGGKTCHIGETEPQLASLTAIDIEERRLKKVRENIERLGIQANIICGDAAHTDTWRGKANMEDRGFDRILLDAPCSATGIIRRQPDIKLLRQAEQVQALVELQLKLLSALWPLLSDGGILLYATCSILPEENADLIERFLSQQKCAKHRAIEADWGIEQTYGRQLFPVDKETGGAMGHDGFYYAKLVKR